MFVFLGNISDRIPDVVLAYLFGSEVVGLQTIESSNPDKPFIVAINATDIFIGTFSLPDVFLLEECYFTFFLSIL